ncbi:MAG: hypothetical protein HYW33_03765 [Candidatus Blackburnbacteria bacterium]|nr:hypothetical protein [Candidatus Blackburnbacteria bacterium]
MPEQDLAAPAPTVVTQTKELFSWHAYARPFKKRNREFFTTVLAVAFLLAVIFFTIGGVLPVVVIISLVFLVYVLSTIAPEQAEHKITTRGMVFAGKTYFWEELTRFWMAERFGSELLIVETTRLPGRIEFVINLEDKEKVKEIMQEYLTNEEAAPTFLDKAASWLSRRIPLEA